MNEHLHVGIPELVIFAVSLLLVGGLLRLTAAWLAQRDSALAQQFAAALGFLY